MTKILVTPRSFAKFNREEVNTLLGSHDIDIVNNPYGRILTEQEMVEAVREVDGLIVGVDPVTKQVIDAAPHLKTIAKYGVGTDNIDVDYAHSLGIKVSITANANSNAVADYTFALLLDVARNVTHNNNRAKSGDWNKVTSLDVFGKKIGVIGLGAIGKGVVSRSKGFNMEVYGYDLYEDETYNQLHDIKFTDIDTIIRECDFITLHLPLTESTKNLLNGENLKNAKNSLIIVNTARGGLIDEDAIFDLLSTGKIYGLGIDAFEIEPPESSPLLTLDNVVVGSHTAAGSEDATNTMTLMAVQNIIRDLEENE